jgi:hypothetical protein
MLKPSCDRPNVAVSFQSILDRPVVTCRYTNPAHVGRTKVWWVSHDRMHVILNKRPTRSGTAHLSGECNRTSQKKQTRNCHILLTAADYTHKNRDMFANPKKGRKAQTMQTRANPGHTQNNQLGDNQ